MNPNANKIIKTFKDGSILKWRTGKFDDFCVSYKKGKFSKWITDKNYFLGLIHLGKIFGNDFVYIKFIELYNLTGKDFKESDLNTIENICTAFKGCELTAEKIFVMLYATMIAEENKILKDGSPTKVGRIIKRVGVHMILKEGYDINTATTYTIGMAPYKIKEIARNQGWLLYGHDR